MNNGEQISKAIITLLDSNVGYGIEFFGLELHIRQLEDLTFAVSHEKYNSETRKHEFDFELIFDNATKATKFFLQKRKDYELGYDFEREIEEDS